MLMRVCSAGSGSNLFVQLLHASMDASDSDSDSSDSDLDDIPSLSLTVPRYRGAEEPNLLYDARSSQPGPSCADGCASSSAGTTTRPAAVPRLDLSDLKGKIREARWKERLAMAASCQ